LKKQVPKKARAQDPKMKKKIRKKPVSDSTAAVGTDQIKVLREKTGGGIMECKKALTQAKGDLEEAAKIIRQKSGSLAAEKAGRATTQGLIGSYVHGGKIGVLVEISCESDFVARNESFKNFVHEVCLQIASMNPVYVKREDVPSEEVEGAIARIQEEIQEVDSEAAPGMQQSAMENFYKDQVLLDQPYVKDSSKTVQDLLNDAVASIRENIVIRRFVRITLGT
jgi:elongation factor Ts